MEGVGGGRGLRLGGGFEGGCFGGFADDDARGVEFLC